MHLWRLNKVEIGVLQRPQSVSSGSITDSSLLNTGGGMDIDQKKTYNFKNPVTIEIKCGPAENFIVNGVPTFEGQKTFKIVITK